MDQEPVSNIVQVHSHYCLAVAILACSTGFKNAWHRQSSIHECLDITICLMKTQAVGVAGLASRRLAHPRWHYLMRHICRDSAHSTAVRASAKAIMKQPSFSWHS